MLFRNAEPTLTFFTLLDVEEQEQKDMQIRVLAEEVERLKTYKTYTDRKIKEEATKIADDLIRDRVPELIDSKMKEIDSKMKEMENRMRS